MSPLYSKFVRTAVAASLCVSTSAMAAGQITFVSQGGAWQEAQTKAILNPAARQLGITINQDSSPDAWPMIRTQGETDKPIWDVVDTPTMNCLRGGAQGLIEKLDYGKIPNAKDLPDGYKSDYSVAYEFYSSVLAYDKDKYKDKLPATWADFWDVKKYPGRRALRNHPLATLEAALMADGVPPDKLYPLDVDRAFRKLEQIKPHITVWWTSGGQSAQLLHDGEVDMIMAWNGRISDLIKAGDDVAYTFNQGVLQSTQLCVLKNAPNRDDAMRFINAAISPDLQANIPAQIDYGPANPAAFKTGKISAERAKELPSAQDNAKRQALMAYDWWMSPAGEAAEKRWLAFMQK